MLPNHPLQRTQRQRLKKTTNTQIQARPTQTLRNTRGCKHERRNESANHANDQETPFEKQTGTQEPTTTNSWICLVEHPQDTAGHIFGHERLGAIGRPRAVPARISDPARHLHEVFVGVGQPDLWRQPNGFGRQMPKRMMFADQMP